MDRPGLFFPFIKGDLDDPNLRYASIDRYWNRASRFFFWVVLFVSLLGFSSVSGAEATPNAELESILRKIESRHYRWIALRAEVLLFFAKAGDSNAMCGGELLYQRLDERMFLTCVDARQELMFAFRALDRRFDLYLPSQKTVYHGSIFDLEDSPDLSSHLKARDLYRALKPLAVDSRRVKIERNNSLVTSLNVYGREGNEGALVRKLYLTPEGDVRGELFYDSKGRPVTEIQRYDFREFRGSVGTYDSIIFPKKITITSSEAKKGSAIFFTKITALDTIDPLEFILRVPDGTKEVFLDEKDPLHRPFKITSVAQTPPRKEFPVYLAKPREIPVPKTTRPPAQKKKEKPAAQEPAATEPVVSPAFPATVTTVSSENADADIALSDQSPEGPSSASNDQTTLDPSVAASLEMGKQ